MFSSFVLQKYTFESDMGGSFESCLRSDVNPHLNHWESCTSSIIHRTGLHKKKQHYYPKQGADASEAFTEQQPFM